MLGMPMQPKQLTPRRSSPTDTAPVADTRHSCWSAYTGYFHSSAAGAAGGCGGIWGDHNDIRTSYIDNYIAVARNIMAAEPSITVRMAGSSPAKAAQLVTYTNIGKA